MKRILKILLLTTFLYSVQAFAEEKYCYIQLFSLKNYKTTENIFKEIHTNFPSYILKFGDFYTVRVGPFKNLKKCKIEKEKLKKQLKKYRINPIIVVNRHSVPPVKFIIKKNIPSNHSVKKSQPRKGKINYIKTEKFLYIEEAKVCMGRNDCSNAVRYLKLAISKSGATPKLYTYLGYAYMHLREYKKSLEAFRKALKLDPKYAEAFAGIGLVYLKLNSPKAAVIAFKKAHDINPKEISYSLNLAIALLESGSLDEAIAEFQKLKDKYPFLSEIYYNEAIAFLKKGDYNKAIEDFKIFLDLTKSYESYKTYRSQVINIINQLNFLLGQHNVSRK